MTLNPTNHAMPAIQLDLEYEDAQKLWAALGDIEDLTPYSSVVIVLTAPKKSV